MNLDNLLSLITACEENKKHSKTYIVKISPCKLNLDKVLDRANLPKEQDDVRPNEEARRASEEGSDRGTGPLGRLALFWKCINDDKQK